MPGSLLSTLRQDLAPEALTGFTPRSLTLNSIVESVSLASSDSCLPPLQHDAIRVGIWPMQSLQNPERLYVLYFSLSASFLFLICRRHLGTIAVEFWKLGAKELAIDSRPHR
jgi:hypothetical protein